MSQVKINQQSKDEIDLYDPEPFTIALSIIQTITPIGTLLAERRIDRFRDEKKRNIAVRNALYDSYRAVNETERLLKDFVSYLDQQGLLGSQFALGRASIIGDPSVIAEIKNLHKDSYSASKKLNDAMIELSKLLDREDFYRCAEFAEKMNQSVRNALRANDYKGYAVSMSRFIHLAQNLIVIIGEKYDFQPSNLS
jgi:hypothetical protein